MKRMTSILILALTILSANVFAADNYVDKLYDELKEKDGVTLVTVTKAMMKMFENQAQTDSDDSIGEISKQIDGIKILSIDLKESGLSSSKIESITKDITERYKKYEVLFEVNQKDDTVKMLSSKSDKDFVMYVLNKEEIVIINAKGIADWNKLLNATGMLGINVHKMMMQHQEKAKAGE